MDNKKSCKECPWIVRNHFNDMIMIHFIVGTIAAGCVIAGFVIGLILIFKKK
jgi:hypothetical protein